MPPFLPSIYYIQSAVLMTLHKLNNLTHKKLAHFLFQVFKCNIDSYLPSMPRPENKQKNNNNKVSLFLFLDFLSRLMIPLSIQMGQAKPYDHPFKLFQLLTSFHSEDRVHFLHRTGHALPHNRSNFWNKYNDQN